MKEYMLRLAINSAYQADWELKFREHEDKQAIDTAVKHLAYIANNVFVVGAQLFRLEPTGTIKEFVPIFIFQCHQRVIVKDATFKEEKPDG